MSQDVGPSSGPAVPTLPERSMLRSDDVAQPPESYDNRSTWRQPEQTTPVRSARPGPSYPRTSEDGPPAAPNQQLTPWQPTDDAQIRSTQRPPYAHSPSQEYGAFDEIEPQQHKDYYIVPRHAGDQDLRYHRSNASVQQPYRRQAYRESTDTYRPLRSEQTPRRGTYTRGRWNDGYEEETPPPPKRTPPKVRGQIYLVREGGDGGDGSDPPNEVLRLPFMDWMQSSAKNRKLRTMRSFTA